MRRKNSSQLFRGFLRGFGGKPDTLFVALFFSIIGIGLLMLSSASAVISFQKFHTQYYYVIHQILFGLLPGLVAFFIAARTPYMLWKKFAFFFLLCSIGFLILVFLPGIGYEYGGAKRWVRIGTFLFQPSEFVKLTFLLYLAAWLSSKGEKNMKDFSYGFLPFATLLGSVALLVILQPDMGTMSIIVLIAFSMYFVGGAKKSHLFLAAGAACGIVLLLIQSASYRFQRLMTFLHPELDPLGIGYHINQALLAVGSGGLFGRGFGHSRQKFAYLPEATGDSIFAIIAEEMGFLLSCALVILIAVFALRGLRIAQNAPDAFGKYVAAGVIAWIVFQSFINIGAMLSLVPLTGIPLPFISYGGSSLVVLMAAVGIVVNISGNGRSRQ